MILEDLKFLLLLLKPLGSTLSLLKLRLCLRGILVYICVLNYFPFMHNRNVKMTDAVASFKVITNLLLYLKIFS